MTARGGSCSKLITNVEVKFTTAAIRIVTLDWDTVIDSNRGSECRNFQPDADTYVAVDIVPAEVIRVFVDKAGVVEHGASNLLHDRERILDGDSRERLTADRLVVFVLRTDIAEAEAAEVVGAAEVEPVIDRHTITVCPRVHSRNLTI